MDYSAANVQLWNGIIQLGYIAGAILLANRLRNRVEFVRKSMMPVAVIAGFMLLFLKVIGVVNIDNGFMEFHSPKLIGAASESGSEVFEVKYFDRKAYLAQNFATQLETYPCSWLYCNEHPYCGQGRKPG